jgi:hypothetical protein
MRMIDVIREIHKWHNLTCYHNRIGKRLFNLLEMIASPRTWKDQWTSEHGAMTIVIALSRRITVRREVIQSCIRDFVCSSFAVWICTSSSISELTQACLSDYKLLASVTFESDSKLQRIKVFAFEWRGWTSIPVPTSIEVLCEKCFYSYQSLPSVPFESDSKLQQIKTFTFVFTENVFNINSYSRIYWNALRKVLFRLRVTYICYIWIILETARSWHEFFYAIAASAFN